MPSPEGKRVEGYLETVRRLEPDIHMIDADAFHASAAISLKRIADALEEAIPLLARQTSLLEKVIKDGGVRVVPMIAVDEKKGNPIG